MMTSDDTGEEENKPPQKKKETKPFPRQGPARRAPTGLCVCHLFIP